MIPSSPAWENVLRAYLESQLPVFELWLLDSLLCDFIDIRYLNLGLASA
jgi:hypothetical protein